MMRSFFNCLSLRALSALAALWLIGLGAFAQQSVPLTGAGGRFHVSASWTPASVATSFWFDANNAGSITKDGSNNVSQWNDLSGNGRNATQATVGNEFVYTTGTLNSLPCLLSNQIANKNMATGAFAMSQPFILMYVYKTTGNAQNGFAIVFDDVNGSDPRPVMFTRRSDISDNTSIYAGTANLVSGAVVSINTGYYQYGIYNGASSESGLNATNASGGTIGTGGISNGVLIGGKGGSNSAEVSYCEIFAITGSSSATDLNNAITYVKNKWGL
jgi:hypothetical protein